MELFDVLLDLYRMPFREVVALPIREAVKFKALTVVRGISCSFKVNLLQKSTVSSTSLSLLSRHFIKWGEDKSNELFRGTKLYTVLIPKRKVDNFYDCFHNAVVSHDFVYEPNILIAAGNSLIWFQKDSLRPTSSVFRLLRGRKLWLFANHGSSTAPFLVKRPKGGIWNNSWRT